MAGSFVLAAAACGQSAIPPGPSVTGPPTVGAATTPPLSAPPSAKRSPAPAPAVRESDLIVRHELSSDVCCPVAVVVVTSDGRAVTRADDGQLIERKLSMVGVELVRDRVLGTGFFDHDQGFALELLPGAIPPAHGIGGLLFRVWAEQRTVTVTSAPLQGDEESRY